MKNQERRIGIVVFLSLSLFASAFSRFATAALVPILDIDANFSDAQNPCKQDNGGHCWITSYVGMQTVDGSVLVDVAPYLGFDGVFTYGGPLAGALAVKKFKTFDEDYDGLLGGVEITASYFPGVNDPLADTEWLWAQIVTLNYRPGGGSSHLLPPASVITTMDDAAFNMLNKPGIAPDPLYPYQYWPDMYGPGPAYGLSNGDFYDRPKAYDHLGYTVFFHALNFLVSDNLNGTYTVYEGFSYGWDFTCCVPEPTSFVVFSFLFGAFVMIHGWRRWRRAA
jgi:hypothetical protein